jgi:hypothetical protein
MPPMPRRSLMTAFVFGDAGSYFVVHGLKIERGEGFEFLSEFGDAEARS